jgi:hypothetical protein
MKLPFPMVKVPFSHGYRMYHPVIKRAGQSHLHEWFVPSELNDPPAMFDYQRVMG